jgi:alkane 1-monooxygenase
MLIHRIKYLAAFILPAVTIFAFLKEGWFLWIPMIYAFVLVPILDAIIPLDDNNLNKEEEKEIKSEKWFNLMLLLILPAHFFVLYLFLTLDFHYLSLIEVFGAVFSAGLSCGVLGINVGHELGHKNDNLSKVVAHLLLMSSLYMHFYVEHNYGHHKNVATSEDPATARRNETVYSFWMRSIFYSYLSAWKIQILLIKDEGFFSFKNNMLFYHIFESLLLLSIYFVFGFEPFLFFIAVAIVGIILLETVNYIEHYGLMRKKEKGFYERTNYTHSWNSNHVFGRLVLFDLSRHSDHHYKSTRPYQILRYHEKSPQLPGGYPAMMLLSLIPPLWFTIIHKRIHEFQLQNTNH